MAAETNDVQIIVTVIKNGIAVAEMSTPVMGGRHELTFSQPIRMNGRHFEGFALEMWIDREARRVGHDGNEVLRPELDLNR